MELKAHRPEKQLAVGLISGMALTHAWWKSLMNSRQTLLLTKDSSRFIQIIL